MQGLCGLFCSYCLVNARFVWAVLQFLSCECKVCVGCFAVCLVNARFVWAVLQFLSSECKVCVGCFAVSVL